MGRGWRKTGLEGPSLGPLVTGLDTLRPDAGRVNPATNRVSVGDSHFLLEDELLVRSMTAHAPSAVSRPRDCISPPAAYSADVSSGCYISSYVLTLHIMDEGEPQSRR